MTLQKVVRRSCLMAALLPVCGSAWAQGTAAASVPVAAGAAPLSCDDLPHADHPKATIANGAMKAVVFLPDAQSGFYRGARFDWAGIVGCASLKGHVFFGEWFNRYDPTLNDAVTGPAEEFRHPTSELGYDDAATGGDAGPGGEFLKIGVGVLRRIDDRPYSFGKNYPIVDHGKWTVKTGKRSVTFRQVLHSGIGFAYVYEKTLSFDKHGNVLTLSHRLRNIGTRPLDTAVYNHDFFMVDHQPIGPGTEVRLPFVPVFDHLLPASATLDGRTVRITAPMEPRRGIGAYVTGFSSSPSDFDFTFEDTTRGIGVEETADSPLVRMYLWGTPTTLCPEGYIGIHVAPGQSQTWTLHYRFFTK